jgi:hypothetical protein
MMSATRTWPDVDMPQTVRPLTIAALQSLTTVANSHGTPDVAPPNVTGVWSDANHFAWRSFTNIYGADDGIPGCFSNLRQSTDRDE